jgi:adenine phosphoribosyltransferase
MDLDACIRSIPDFPKPGILFKDITPLLQNPQAFAHTIDAMAQNLKDADIIVGLDAR